jgi:hypothetical protein
VLIFGTSTRTVQLAMLNLLCQFCGNPSAHALRKRVTKFSLFFIPLFPLGPAGYTLQCTFCGGTSQVTKDNADQLLAQGAGQQPGPQPGQMQGYGQPPAPPQGNPYAGQPQPGTQPGQPPQNPYQQNPYQG